MLIHSYKLFYKILSEFNYINQLRAMKKGGKGTFFQRQLLDNTQQ